MMSTIVNTMKMTSPTNDSRNNKNFIKGRKFIAFINALLTLAYCMTNCFRKPSTKDISFSRFPETNSRPFSELKYFL